VAVSRNTEQQGIFVHRPLRVLCEGGAIPGFDRITFSIRLAASCYYFLTSLAHIEVAVIKIIPSRVREVRNYRRVGSLDCPKTPLKQRQSKPRKIPEGRRSHDT